MPKQHQEFISESLDLLDRTCRDRLLEFPSPNDARHEIHHTLVLTRLKATYDTPVIADDERCARLLVHLDRVLRDRIMVLYRPAQGAGASEQGRWRSDGTMFIRPGRPSRMLQTMLHESAHMFAQLGGVIEELDTEANEVIAESAAYAAMRALGIESLSHSSAYVTNNCVGGKITPGSLRDLIVPIVEAILSFFPVSDLEGVR